MAESARKILVFGGSFNPIHEGHLALGRFARDRIGFSPVLFVPNGDNYPKKGLAPAEDRLALVRAAVEGERGLEALDVEARSAEKFQTYRTVKELQDRYPGGAISVLRGLDSLHRVPRRLFDLPGVRVLAVGRQGCGDTLEDVLARYPHLADNRRRIDFVDGFRDPLSSTAVRSAIAAGRPVEGMVPPRVLEEIRKRGLYGAGAGNGEAQAGERPAKMETRPRKYDYVGPHEIAERVAAGPRGKPIRDRAELIEWCRSPAAEMEWDREGRGTVTFVISEEGALLVAPRRSEHVGCAGGRPVISAGEMTVCLDGEAIDVVEITNQSTGYCPEAASWPAVAAALDRSGLLHPGRFTSEIVFRRCPSCGERNIVKEGWFRCALCDAALPGEWNFR